MELAWATVNPLNTARAYLGAAGTQTAALAFGGYWRSNFIKCNRRI
jgi:hypothetical protein